MTQPSPPQQPRLLALDLGESRVGVALSDELGLFAHPRPAIHVRSEAQLVDSVEALVRDEAVAEVIVGLPLTLAGAYSQQAEAFRGVVSQLRRRLAVPVREWDERLSSTQAARSVRGAAKRKSGELDSAAAAVVLQSVLDSRKGGASR